MCLKLFFQVLKIVWSPIRDWLYISGLTAIIEIKESNIMLGLNSSEDVDVIINIIIFISKWEIWKIRNKVIYNQSRIGDQTIFNTWKNNLRHIYNITSFILICFYFSS
jgi:hypothetical protein